MKRVKPSDVLLTPITFFTTCLSIASLMLSGCSGRESVNPEPEEAPAWTILATGAQLGDVWCSPHGDVYVTGSHGLIMKHDGTSWTLLRATTSSTGLYGIWGSGDDCLFAVGRTLLRFDGHAWHEVSLSLEYFLDVWGWSCSDVYAVGSSIMHFDGHKWSPMEAPVDVPLRSVWGSSPSNVIAVGEQGKIIRYDGEEWRSEISGTDTRFNCVWGASDHDVWAVGDRGMILHYDGTTWDGGSQVDGDLYGVWGRSATDIFAVGHYGVIYHYDGETWSELANMIPSLMYDVTGDGAGNVFAVGLQSVLHYSGSAWESMIGGLNPPQLSAVWGTDTDNLFAVGRSGGLFHFDGHNWHSQRTFGKALRDVWGDGEGAVFAVGEGGTILRYADTSWSAMASGKTISLSSVFGDSSGHVYAVGDSGIVLGYDGSSWTEITRVSTWLLNAVWVSPSGTVHVAGMNALYRQVGTSWENIAPIDADFQAMWGSSDEDIFVSGTSGELVHFDGEEWVLIETEFGSGITDLAGCSSGRMVAVTDGYASDASLRLYDKGEWQTILEMPNFGDWPVDAWVGSDCETVVAVGRAGWVAKALLPEY